MTARVLDEATRKALQGLTPFSVKSTIKYIPEAFEKLDVPEDCKPVFTIRGLTVAEGKELDEMVARAADNSDMMKFNSDAFDLTRKCITGWVNLFDAGSGEEIEYKQDSQQAGADAETFDILPVTIKADLFRKVMSMHGLSGTDKASLP